MGIFNSTCNSEARLSGKTVVITGANAGIGKETARDLYYRGAKVILACRNLSKANNAIEDIKQNRPKLRPNNDRYKGNPGELVAYELDLSKFSSVKACAQKLINEEAYIHILINNAGMVCPKQETEDGNDCQFQSNYLGHFLFTLLLIPKIKISAPGCRIVNVTSVLHERGSINFDDINKRENYLPLRMYYQSKLANVLFTSELARKLKENDIEGINTYTLHPGVIWETDMARNLNSILIECFRLFSNFFFKYFFKNSEQGAQTSIHCAVDEEAGGETGMYYRECKPSQASNKARDAKLAAQLWDESFKLLGAFADDVAHVLDKTKAMQN